MDDRAFFATDLALAPFSSDDGIAAGRGTGMDSFEVAPRLFSIAIRAARGSIFGSSSEAAVDTPASELSL
jgi:hypothetical protein